MMNSLKARIVHALEEIPEKGVTRYIFPVSLFAIFITLLMGLEEIIDDALEGETRQFDMWILTSLRNPADLSDPVGPLWVEEMMRDFTALGGFSILTLLTVSAALYLFIIHKRLRAFYLVGVILSGSVLSNLLKMGFDRPRPDFVPHESYVYSTSLPSGHSLMSALVYLTLGALLADAQPKRRLKVFILSIAVFIAVLVGISRVYLGVHWPSDVLAGWMIGCAWALMFWTIERYFLKLA